MSPIELHCGLLVGDRRNGAFKVIIVIGPSKKPGRFRVATWSDNARSWSGARTADPNDLCTLTSLSPTPRQRRTIQHAFDAIKTSLEIKVPWNGGFQWHAIPHNTARAT